VGVKNKREFINLIFPPQSPPARGGEKVSYEVHKKGNE
jgi:hypothetical protein